MKVSGTIPPKEMEDLIVMSGIKQLMMYNIQTLHPDWSEEQLKAQMNSITETASRIKRRIWEALKEASKDLEPNNPNTYVVLLTVISVLEQMQIDWYNHIIRQCKLTVAPLIREREEYIG